MKLRQLQKKDAPFMLEWMHDKNVCEFMQRDFAAMTLGNCLDFIDKSSSTDETLNLAVVDDTDEYMGTVSLKHIDKATLSAEFAITIRRCAMGKGISRFAMAEIISKGLKELGLESVIWCVSKDNIRANRFYEKNGYSKISAVPEKYQTLYPQWENMNWFEVRKNEQDS